MNPRKKDPVKYCANPDCGKLLKRKRQPSKALEKNVDFAKRKYCSLSCLAHHKKLKRAAQIASQKADVETTKKNNKAVDLINETTHLKKELKYYQSKDKTEREKLYWTNVIIESVKESLSIIPNPKPYKRVQFKTHTKENQLIGLWGDWHTGKAIDTKETGGVNQYNIEKFKGRLNQLVNTTLDITELHRRNSKIETFRIYLMGDILDGTEIFRGQDVRQDSDVINQVLITTSEIANAITEISKCFESVEVVAISGNHSRLGKFNQNKWYVNYEYMMYRFVETMLERVDNVNIKIPTEWFTVDEVFNKRHLITHGDSVKSWNSIPYYGIQRAVNEWLSMMKSQGIDFDNVFMGHFHHSMFFEYQQGCEVFLNGCLCGSDYYSMKQMRKTSTPSQFLLGVHPEHGITYRYVLRLD